MRESVWACMRTMILMRVLGTFLGRRLQGVMRQLELGSIYLKVSREVAISIIVENRQNIENVILTATLGSRGIFGVAQYWIYSD
jgi:hypothetical protein